MDQVEEKTGKETGGDVEVDDALADAVGDVDLNEEHE